MLGIGFPDRHALPRITSSKLPRLRSVLPSRASGFVHRRVSPIALRLDEGPLTERTASVQQARRELVFMPPLRSLATGPVRSPFP